MSHRMQGWLLVALTAVLSVVAWRVFPLAQPTIALRQEVTREQVIARARAFAQQHGLPVDSSQVAVRFIQDEETQTYLEREAGGKQGVDREVQGKDVALFRWTVRFFRPGLVSEVRVQVATDGRVIGFTRRLAETDARPTADSVAAEGLARTVVREWLAQGAVQWEPVATSLKQVQPSGRIDRTITYERRDRTVGGATLRLDVVVHGNAVGGAQPYVKIPETFTRRYGEMRSANELLANLASAAVPVYLITGLVALAGLARRGRVRWRPAALAGLVIGAASFAAVLNDIPGSWFGYDTAVSPSIFLVQQGLLAVVAGVGLGIGAAVLLATGEGLTRDAFPAQYDWWQYRQYAGTWPIAVRLLSGYTLAAFGLAYVSLFYLGTTALGWWSPSSILDDPDRIASPLPWISAIAQSLQAGVLEEVLFRAIPLALISRWVGTRPSRPWVMTGGVIITALVFGFAHANYPSWPAHARGVELFAEAALWAVVFLRFGLPTTIVAHFTYDLLLFGLFAAAGTAWPYRITLGVVVLAAATPALVVAWQWWRHRASRADPPASARFGAWQPAPHPPLPAPSLDAAVSAVYPVPVFTHRRVAFVVATIGLIAAGLTLRTPPRGPGFSRTRAEIMALADSIARALGAEPSRFTRLATSSGGGGFGTRRFLLAQGEDIAQGALAIRLDSTFTSPGGWDVRYLHHDGPVAARAEQWLLELSGDGRLLSWSHTVPETLTVAAVPRADAERLARTVATRGGASFAPLQLLDATEEKRPNRLDVTFTFQDTTVHLPAGASARVEVTVAGPMALGVQPLVHLPEAWQRADRAMSQRHSIVSFVYFVGIVLAVLVLVVRIVRRRTPVREDRLLSPRALRWVIGVAAGGSVLLAYNRWPAGLTAYDTAQDWWWFILLQHLAVLGAAVGIAVLVALWGSVSALRARVGVPTVGPASEVVLVGAALAGLFLISEVAFSLIGWGQRGGPQTAMDEWLPAVGMLQRSVSMVTAFVPPLAILGCIAATLTPRPRLAFALAATLGYAAIISASGAVSDQEWLLRLALGWGLALGQWWVLTKIGGHSVASWCVAGLLLDAVRALGGMRYALTPADGIAHLLALVGGVVLIDLILREARARSGKMPVAPVPSEG